MSGLSLKESLEASGLPRHSLKKIWDLSDIDEDGSLDILEFSVAKYLIETVQAYTIYSIRILFQYIF